MTTTLTRLALRGLVHHRRTHASVAAGVASAVAVLAGALLVGSSVRASLASIASARLGRAEVVVAAETPFGEDLADRIARLAVTGAVTGSVTGSVSRGPVPGERGQAPAVPGERGQAPRVAAVAPMLVLQGVAEHDSSHRRANGVRVYGVDDRFFAFHGVAAHAPAGASVWLSPDLAAELAPAAGDAVIVRVTRPTDIPLDSLHGRHDDVGRSLRLTYGGTFARDDMGEFELAPSQGPVRAVFIALSRLQKDLNQPERVNTLLVAAAGGPPMDAARVGAALGRAIDANDLGLRISASGASSIVVDASSGLLTDAIGSAVEAAAARESLASTPVLTWLANRMTAGARVVPYSLIAALGPTADGDETIARLLRESLTSATNAGAAPPPIVLNDWAARDLQPVVGAPIQIEYFRWLDEGRLVTEHATFRFAGVVPMQGLARDRRLTPNYPGITESNSLADWDPPFPIDLALVRPIDNDYWKQFRATPKAFIPLADGQRLWRTRHGAITSMRLRAATTGVDLHAAAARLEAALPRAVDPIGAGFTVVDVRRQSLAAAEGATDFGAYFGYFSFFLMVSALLLAALFFRLSIEQRLAEIGVLRAAGFSIAAIRRVFWIEGAIVSLAGAIAGVALAIAWARLMLYGLGTWWVGAVGTTELALHVTPLALVAGGAAGGGAALVSIALTVGGLSRRSPRALITGTADMRGGGGGARARGATTIAVASVALAVTLAAASAARLIAPAGAFFGAGALVLVGGIAALARRLRPRRYREGVKRPRESFRATRETRVSKAPEMETRLSDRARNDSRGRFTDSRYRLGVRNASWRPGRSLTAAGLVAAAVFLLVSVDAFRKSAPAPADRASGTGGFALIGESALPFVDDPSTPAGREALGLASGDSRVAGVDLVAARLRPGDDASCLNLYQPKRPRIVGVPDRLIDAGRFRFAASIGSTDGDRANPWRLLGPADAEGIVPAIADATSLEYVLHASVGDVLTIDADSARPIRLRLVAALADSMLQGELVIAERAFTSLFPDIAGYRLLLVDMPASSAASAGDIARALEDRLAPFGLDVEDSAARLAAYHRVENTYLSTFQTLGGLGLVLGCLGLAAIIARNVIERRRELALLGATGFTGADLQWLVLAEQIFVVGAGLAIGLVAALVAVGPVLVSRGGELSARPLIWIAIVMAAGVLSTLAATRRVRRLPILAGLRSD